MVQVGQFGQEFGDTPFAILTSLFEHSRERFVCFRQVMKDKFAIQ
jgi:hypothetical protein